MTKTKCKTRGCKSKVFAKNLCKTHYARKWYKENPDKARERARRYWEKHPDKIRGWAREWARNNKEKVYERNAKYSKTIKGRISTTKSRAKKLGINFDDKLCEEDLRNCDMKKCPICGVGLLTSEEDRNGKRYPNSPSLDRIDPSKGYIRGNVCVICIKCNSKKQDNNIEWLEKVIEYIKNPPN